MKRREALQRAALVLGYAITGPALVGIMKGCKAVPELTYSPKFFNNEQALFVSELAELIIPRTDTPGAKDVGVPGFIDQMLKDVYSEEAQNQFLSGLKKFNDDAVAATGHPFVECSEEEKHLVFRKHHNAALSDYQSKKGAGFWGSAVKEEKPFVLLFKELTMLGFFTSEAGASQVLQYNQVPGPYKGCVPVEEVGKTWAT